MVIAATRCRLTLVQVAVLLLCVTAFLRADDAPIAPSTTTTRHWKDTGEFSAVSTNGNSKATTMSAKNTYTYHWTRSVLELIGGALGSSSASQITAEQYNASEKFTRMLAGENYVFEQGSWEKNRFAGIADRYNGNVGVGRLLLNLPSDKITSELGGGYINEQRTESPRNDFVSGRAYAKYAHKISPTATFTQDAEYLHDFSDLKDYRLNTETAVIASLTSTLSLKASYTWKRVAEPPPGIGKDDTTTAVAFIVNYE